MEESRTIRLCVTLDAHSDSAERESAAQILLNELTDLVPSVRVVRGTAHAPGSKDAGQAISAGQIVLGLLASGGVVSSLVAGVQGWILRNGAAEVEIAIGDDKIHIKGLSLRERDQRIDEFLARHIDHPAA